MRGVALWFVSLGTVFLLVGMVWGIQMSASQDHTLSPAHGHLNLIGFVLFCLFGLYYHVVEEAAETKVAKLHFALSVVTVIVMVPGIVSAINQTGETMAKLGSVLGLVTGLMFLYVVMSSRQKA